MENQKPEALELADILENLAHPTGTRHRAATELRRQHARIQELEAMLEAVGAGGVSAQRIRQEPDHITQPRKMVAAQEPFGYFKAEPFGWRDCAETDEGAIALYEAPQPQADAGDTERLDWLIGQGCHHGVVYEGLDKSFWMVWLDGHDAHKDEHQKGRYHTAREAIDAAIAKATGVASSAAQAAKENK